MESEGHNAVYLAIGLVVCILFVVVRFWFAGRNDKTLHTYAALNSPTVRAAGNAFDRRVALAVRGANRGYHVCPGCGFTNPFAASSCVLCGVAIKDKNEETTEGRFPWLCRNDAEQVLSAAASESERQRRIRRRREWTRRVDDQGVMRWHHDGSLLPTTMRDSTAVSFPAYALKASGHTSIPGTVRRNQSPPHTSSHSQPGSPIINCDDAHDVIVVVRTPRGHAVPSTTPPSSPSSPPHQPSTSLPATAERPPPSLSVVSSRLQAAIDHAAINLATVDDVEPTHMPVLPLPSDDAPPSNAEPSHSVTDSAHYAELDFPSKLAQFITATASLFSTSTSSTDEFKSRLSIQRPSLLSDSIAAIASLTHTQMRASIRVDFVQEQGIDAGGVYREWFVQVNQQIVSPEAGIFLCTNQHDQTFYLHPQSREILGEQQYLAHCFAAGRLHGRALLEGNATGFHLALPLLKIILGLPVAFYDLEYLDPEVYTSLKWLVENDDVDALGLDFTVVEKLPNGSPRVVELVPGGSNIDVMDANKLEYVDRQVRYLLFDRVSSQLYAFLQGLYQVVPAALLRLFDPEELDYVLSGSDEINVDDWESHTIISSTLAMYPAHEMFWKVVRELSTEEKRRLLQFATGSTRVPPGGFAALTSHDGRLALFTLRGVRVKATHGHLHSHACFNRVDLPMYASLKKMRAAVYAAISSESTGFTTA